jgi:hypothetical protein
MAEDNEIQVSPVSGLQAAVDQEKANREIIKHYVSDQLVKGVDYGVIVGNKPTLLKPGMEKIFSLMKITSTIEKDADTWEMLGSKAGMVCYKAILHREDGIAFAEGRGSAVVGEKNRDANSTVKIAEKRARMDACLSLGFSEFFTQDLEDMDTHPSARSGHEVTESLNKVYDTEKPASPKQIAFVRTLMVTKAGVKTVAQGRSVMEQYGVEPKSIEKLTMTEAKLLIDALINTKSIPVPSDEWPELEENPKAPQRDPIPEYQGDDEQGYPGDDYGN